MLLKFNKSMLPTHCPSKVLCPSPKLRMTNFMFGQKIKSSTGATHGAVCVCIGSSRVQKETNTDNIHTLTYTHASKCNAKTKLTSQPTAASIPVHVCVRACVT